MYKMDCITEHEMAMLIKLGLSPEQATIMALGKKDPTNEIVKEVIEKEKTNQRLIQEQVEKYMVPAEENFKAMGMNFEFSDRELSSQHRIPLKRVQSMRMGNDIIISNDS